MKSLLTQVGATRAAETRRISIHPYCFEKLTLRAIIDNSTAKMFKSLSKYSLQMCFWFVVNTNTWRVFQFTLRWNLDYPGSSENSKSLLKYLK